MAVDALYKDRDSRVQTLEAEVWRQFEAYVEERAMRKMLEQQYVSLKKKVGSQISGSFSYMGVLRSDVPSASLGAWLARHLRRREVTERRAVRDRILEMVMAATVVLREEERASREVFLYFSLFLTHLCFHHRTSF